MCAAYDRCYLRKEDFGELFDEGTQIRKMTVRFVSSMVKHGSGVKHLRKMKSWTDQVWECYERITGEQRPPLFVTRSDQDDAPG